MTGSRRKPVHLESEQSLVSRAKSGDSDALSRLLEIHYSGMLRLATKYSQSPEAGRDVLQDSCIKVMQSIRQLREEARFSPWMSKIVINTARIHHRTNRRFVELKGDWAKADLSQKSPEEQLDHRQKLNLVIEALQHGRDEDYQLFLRRYVVGQSDHSISRDMGLSVTALKTRVHRARAHLRVAVEA